MEPENLPDRAAKLRREARLTITVSSLLAAFAIGTAIYGYGARGANCACIVIAGFLISRIIIAASDLRH